MKRLLIFSLIIFASCAPIAPKISTYVTDVRVHYAQGFFITSAPSVNERYRPIGRVITEAVAGKIDKQGYGYYGVLVPVPFEDALKKFVEEAKKLGANAVMDFKVDYASDTYYITGFAIKIE